MDSIKKHKVAMYHRLNETARKNEIVFAGSSLCEFFPIYELQKSLAPNVCIYNRGVGGFTSAELLEAINDCILDLKPHRLFINIGTNDLCKEEAPFTELFSNYRKILTHVRNAVPGCGIYIMAYYPINLKADFGLAPEHKAQMFGLRTNEAICAANALLPELAAQFDARFIDVNKGLTDENGNLRSTFAIDGMHMWPAAYEIVLKNMLPYLR